MIGKILVIGWMFTAGFCPIDHAALTDTTGIVTTNTVDLHNNATHVGMSFNAVVLDHFNLRGSVGTWQEPLAWNNWSPYRVGYDIGADVSLMPYNDNKFNVLLSVDRSCSHPINEWGNTNGKLNTAYCEVKLTVRGTADIF